MLKYLGSECLRNSLVALRTARATEVSVRCRTMPEEGVYCQRACYMYFPRTTLRELPAVPCFRLGNGIDLVYWQCVLQSWVRVKDRRLLSPIDSLRSLLSDLATTVRLTKVVPNAIAVSPCTHPSQCNGDFPKFSPGISILSADGIDDHHATFVLY